MLLAFSVSLHFFDRVQRAVLGNSWNDDFVLLHQILAPDQLWQHEDF